MNGQLREPGRQVLAARGATNGRWASRSRGCSVSFGAGTVERPASPLAAIIPLLGLIVVSLTVWTAREFVYARVAYGLLAFVALALLMAEAWRWGWIGLATPLAAILCGFLYFFCSFPLLNPQLVPGLYGDPERVRLLVAMHAIALLSFLAGYQAAAFLPWRGFEGWWKRPVSRSRLSRAIVLLFVVYVSLAIYMAAVGKFSVGVFLSISTYRITDIFPVLATDPASYYLRQVLRWLPIAVAPLAALDLVSSRRALLPRLWLTAVLLLLALTTVASGIRYVMLYTLGSVAMTFLLKGPSSGARSRFWRALGVSLILLCAGLAALQLQTREIRGLGAMVSGDARFDLVEAARGTVSELGADQNYTSGRVLEALSNNSLQPVWGETVLLAFVQMIPRAIWQSKPGGDMAKVLGRVNPFAKPNVSYGITGEFALNFTLWGLPLAMLLFGGLCGAWWSLFLRHRWQPRMLALYAMSFVPLVFVVRGSFATMFGALFHSMVVAIIALSYARADKRGR